MDRDRHSPPRGEPGDPDEARSQSTPKVIISPLLRAPTPVPPPPRLRARGSDQVLPITPFPPLHRAALHEVTDLDAVQVDAVDDADLRVGDSTAVDISNLSVGDRTELLPSRVWARRRARIAWLVGSLAAFAGAGVVTLAVSPTVSPSSTAALESDAVWIASAIDASATTARIRADGLARLPMLQAGVLTDAATVADLVASEISLPTGQGETLELVQLRGAQRTVLLRIPPTAPALAPIAAGELRLARDARGGLAIVAGAGVDPYKDPVKKKHEIAGALALSVPVDLSPAAARLAEHAASATLTGAGDPIALGPTSDDAGAAVSVPIAAGAAWNPGGLTLSARPRSTVAGWKLPLQFALSGLGLAMMVIFVLRRRG